MDFAREAGRAMVASGDSRWVGPHVARQLRTTNTLTHEPARSV
jgi:hypothetical protein